MEELKVGETVKLKSGGPVMTIVRIDTVQGVICGYFNAALEFKQIILDNTTPLMKAIPPSLR